MPNNEIERYAEPAVADSAPLISSVQEKTMNGPIAQIVALACHANAFLAGHDIGSFFPENSTCTFCDRVNFVVLQKSLFGKAKEKQVAGDPNEWFSYLKKSGAIGLRLTRTPQNDPNISDRMAAGFVGGGGTWAVEVVFPNAHSDYWLARWEVWNQNAPEQRIWRVTYGRVSSSTQNSPPAKTDLARVSADFSKALSNIHAFSAKHECGGFTKCFSEALDTLRSKGEDRHGYHRDLAPAGCLSSEAGTVLDACQRAWVFGGMGSWNDMGFPGEEQREYEEVSDKLFTTLTEAVIVAVNSTFGLERADALDVPSSPQ